MKIGDTVNHLKMNRNRAILIMVIIIILQVGMLLYWSSVKTSYHVDELYSMGYASSFTGQTYNSKYITTSKDFWFNKWISNSDLKEYIVMSDDESVFSAPFSVVMKKMVTGRNYMGLLNLAESLFGNGTISHRPGFILNVVFYILTDVFLYLLFKRLGVREHIRYLAVLMIGLTGYMISAAEFIRFYMLVIFLTVIMLILSYIVWNTDNWRDIILATILNVLIGYFSILDSELTLPFFGGLFGCLLIACIVRHKKKQYMAGIIALLGGIAFLAIRTNFLELLIRPDATQVAQSSWHRASVRMRSTSPDRIKYYLEWIVQLLYEYFFASFSVLILFGGIITICIVLGYAFCQKKESRLDPRKINEMTVASIILWIGMLGVTTVLGKGRLICLTVIFALVLIGFGEAMGYSPRFLRIKISSDTVFIIALLSGSAIYTVFLIMCDLDTWRYFCYMFVAVAVSFWFIIDRIMKKTGLRSVRRNIYIGLAVFVVINSIIPFHTRNIKYMFEDERSFIDTLGSYRDLDVIMFLPVNQDTIRIEETGYLSRHAAYDCVYLMPEKTKLYVTELEGYTFDRFILPDEFIVWTPVDCDITDAINELNRNGYDVHDIGYDHNSRVYVARGT